MASSLRPHGLQHARLPCLSPTPRVYSNSCPLSRWCHPTISSSVVPFSSRLQSFPASGSFLMSQFFASGGQSIGVSASVLVFPTDVGTMGRVMNNFARLNQGLIHSANFPVCLGQQWGPCRNPSSPLAPRHVVLRTLIPVLGKQVRMGPRVIPLRRCQRRNSVRSP